MLCKLSNGTSKWNSSYEMHVFTWGVHLMRALICLQSFKSHATLCSSCMLHVWYIYINKYIYIYKYVCLYVVVCMYMFLLPTFGCFFVFFFGYINVDNYYINRKMFRPFHTSQCILQSHDTYNICMLCYDMEIQIWGPRGCKTGHV